LAVSDNDVSDNHVGIAIGRNDGRFEDNMVQGGAFGIVMESGGSPTLVGNTVEGASDRGVFIGDSSSLILEGNRVCENGRNLVVEGDAVLPISDTNEICEDAIAE
jgi:parallel beta-helix repeat protein